MLCLLASDFPSENPRTQTRTFLTRTVANKWLKKIVKRGFTKETETELNF